MEVFESLPNEVIVYIFNYVSVVDLIKFQLNKRLQYLIKNVEWKQIVKTRNIQLAIYLATNFKFYHYDLRFVNISELNLNSLFNCKSLKLEYSSGLEINNIKKIRKCRKISLCGTSLVNTSGIFHNKNISKNLLDLNLSFTQLTDDIFDKLFIDQKILNKSPNLILDTPEVIPKTLNHQFVNLQTLNLENCFFITDKIATHFGKLRVINLSNCRHITDVTVSKLATVEELCLSGCYRVTDESVKHLGKLKVLNLAWCSQITDSSVACLSNLFSLDLTGCFRITDYSASCLSNVSTLILRYCDLITDESICTLNNIIHLNLRECDQITDSSIFHLATLTSLKKLTISRCDQITGQSVINLKNLDGINLEGCTSVSTEIISELKSFVPNLYY